MIDDALRNRAVKTIMIKLRSMGPCGVASLKSELLVQCIGVTKKNVDEVFDVAWKYMGEAMMVQEYEMISPEPDDVPVYEVHESMYGPDGNYLGDD